MTTVFIWFANGKLQEFRHVQQIEWTRDFVSLFISGEKQPQRFAISTIHKVDVIP